MTRDVSRSAARRVATEHTLAFGMPLPGGSNRLGWRGTALVGILNVTPDSFSDGAAYPSVDSAVAAGVRMVAEGALFVDVGGESTRPGARDVPVDEELGRVLPVVAALRERDVIVSVDTRKPTVAEGALAAGAAIVNDVSGLRDERMVAVCAAAGAPAVVMHMLGEPATMQVEPRYEDVVAEVKDYLVSAARRALAAGVPSVMIDPGLGFGKTIAHNLELVDATEALVAEGYPVMVGASRKSFLGRIAGVEDARGRLGATLALHLHAAARGAALLRVHDVEPHRQALAVAERLQGGLHV